jgi:hypothetical protein
LQPAAAAAAAAAARAGRPRRSRAARSPETLASRQAPLARAGPRSEVCQARHTNQPAWISAAVRRVTGRRRRAARNQRASAGPAANVLSTRLGRLCLIMSTPAHPRASCAPPHRGAGRRHDLGMLLGPRLDRRERAPQYPAQVCDGEVRRAAQRFARVRGARVRPVGEPAPHRHEVAARARDQHLRGCCTGRLGDAMPGVCWTDATNARRVRDVTPNVHGA